MDHPNGFKRDHILDKLIAPIGVSKIIFAPHVYSVLSTGSDAAWQMQRWQDNAVEWGNVPIIVGEWAVNSEQDMETNISAYISANQGACYWAYAPYKLNKINQQLIGINGEPTDYWHYLIEAYANVL